MPKLNDASMENVQTNTSFTYSATRLADLGATEYTLATIMVDVSGSVGAFQGEMEACLQEVIKACKYSPRADNLMLRVLTFNDKVTEMHGFKLLSNCDVNDYRSSLRCGGNTALFDATLNGIQAMGDYAKSLTKNDYAVNCLGVIITDGDDNSSAFKPTQVKAMLEAIVREEQAESIRTILVGVNTAMGRNVTQFLQDFKAQAKLDQYEDVSNANAKTLAKLADFISKSISAQSQALGSGGPSKPISMSF